MISENDRKLIDDYRLELFDLINRHLATGRDCRLDLLCPGEISEITLSVFFPGWPSPKSHPQMLLKVYVVGEPPYEYAGMSVQDCIELARIDLKQWEKDFAEAQDDGA